MYLFFSAFTSKPNALLAIEKASVLLIIIIIIIVHEEGDVTVLWNQAVHTDREVLWNQAVHTDREVTANRPDIIIKNKTKKENMHTDRCGNTRRQKFYAKGSGKEVKIQEFMYRDTTIVEPEMYDYTSNN